MNLRDLYFKINVNQTRKGLELGNLDFKVGHLDLSEDGSKSSLDGLALTADGEEQDGLINYTLHTQIDKLVLPTPVTLGKALEVSYVGDMAFRRLDEEALLGLQKTAQQLRDQGDNPMKFMILLGKLMEVSPKLLAKSPKIALNQLTVKTPTGDLQGNASISLNGKTATSLDMSVLMSALQAQAEFSISKHLLKQVLASQILDSMLEETAEDNQQLDESEMAFLKQQANAASEQQISVFVALKWLVDSGDDNYKLVANFKNNKLTINGQEMPLPFP